MSMRTLMAVFFALLAGWFSQQLHVAPDWRLAGLIGCCVAAGMMV